MPEVTWILDPITGDLVVEGLEADEALALAGDLLPNPEDLNCARPLQIQSPSFFDVTGGPTLRVAGLWHASVVEGPGRRSVLACQGCNLGCRGCFVPLTHAFDGGAVVPVDALVELLLDPSGEPRDGVTILGGEACAPHRRRVDPCATHEGLGGTTFGTTDPPGDESQRGN